MHAIIKSLCSLWRPSWQGMVMGELKYRKGPGGSGPYKVSATGRRIVRVYAVSPSEERMDLMLFPAAGFAGGGRKEAGGTYWHTFSADEVRRYSASAGDHNEIHQTDCPIVSGFQIAEGMAALEGAPDFRIRFHYPVRSGEAVSLRKEGKVIYGMTDVLCFVWEAL